MAIISVVTKSSDKQWYIKCIGALRKLSWRGFVILTRSKYNLVLGRVVDCGSFLWVGGDGVPEFFLELVHKMNKYFYMS